MKRRDLLKMSLGMSAGAMMGAGLWPGRLRAEDNGKGNGEWTFIAVNDLHFQDDTCGPWFEKVIVAMKQSAPGAAFCLLGGDLANDGKPEQLSGVREVFQKLGMPLYATPGNHDYLADADRKAYEQNFPGHINHVIHHKDWQVIGLDSSDGTRYQNTTIQPGTFAWLDLQLPKLEATRPTIIWTHFPLGLGVTYRPVNASLLLERFVDFNLQAVFSGHWHGFTEKSWHNATLTTDRYCARVRDNHDGTKEKGWFVCTAKDGKISRRFVEIPKI